MRILCLGQQNWDYCWTAKQQLLTRLARRGHRVLYVDPAPVEQPSWSAGLRALAPTRTLCGVREVRPDVFVHTYVHAPWLRYRVNTWRRARVTSAIAHRLGFDGAIAVVLHPAHAPLVRALRPRGLVYFAVDDVTAFPRMRDADRAAFAAAEQDLLQAADAAVAVSPRLHARFAERCPRSVLLPNGADLDHFGPTHLARVVPHPEVAGLPRPRIGFIGQVDERLDQELIEALACAHPEWTFVLAGRVKRGVDVARLEALPNVRFLGYQPYDRLPSILRELDVCTIPYVRNDLTHACNPLKAFEYLAAGMPVVATPLEGLGPVRECIAVADAPAEFAAAIARALRNVEAGRRERLAFAARHGWDARVDDLEALLAEVDADRGAPVSRARGTVDDLYASAAPTWRSAWLMRASTAWGWMRRHSPRSGGLRRILVARRCRLGDLLVFLPALHALRRRFPAARIVLATQPGGVPPALHPLLGVDEVREIDRPERTRRQRLADARALLADRFDLVLSGAGFFMLRDAIWAAAPHRVGLSDGHPLQRYHTAAIELDQTRHEAENNLRLVEALGAGAVGMERVPHLGSVSLEHQRDAAALLETLGIGQNRAFVLLHPGAQKPSRRWPADRFAALIARTLDARGDLHAILTGVDGEAALAARILDALPPGVRARTHDLTGATALLTMVALMQRARAVVCNDTGTMHLARAAGAPLLALLGPENHRRWGPHPVGRGAAIALRHEVPCAPCQRWSCDALYCLKMLSVDEAWAALQALMRRPPAAGAHGDALDLRLVRHHWESVSDAGLPLPLVSVVMFARREAGDRPRDSLLEIDGLLQTVRAQTYPNVEVVLAHRTALPPLDGAHEAVRTCRVGAGGAAELAAIVAQARGEFITPIAPGYRWAPSKLAEDVAALIRRPDVSTVFCGFEERHALAQPAIGSATYRRSMLAAHHAGARPGVLRLHATLASMPTPSPEMA